MWVPGGGRLLPGRPGAGALPPPTARPLGRAAGAHYPLAVGAGGAGVGTHHQPHRARSWEPALRCCSGGMRVPGGGASSLGVGRPGYGALRTPDHSSSRLCGPGPTTNWLWVRGVRAWGPVTNPTARALASWLCALWGRHVGALGGGASCLGVRGGALSHPQPPVLWGVRPGPTTHWLWVRGVRAWGPVTYPTARALASWLCALWGRHEGMRGGRLSPACGASGFGRSPIPDHSSFRACGRGSLPTGCGSGGCGRDGPSPAPQRALLRAGFARCGGGMGAPGGGTSCLGVGRPGSGALPPLTTLPFGRAAGAHYPLAVGAGGAGMGTRH